jgi:hypothetical protein
MFGDYGISRVYQDPKINLWLCLKAVLRILDYTVGARLIL